MSRVILIRGQGSGVKNIKNKNDLFELNTKESSTFKYLYEKKQSASSEFQKNQTFKEFTQKEVSKKFQQNNTNKFNIIEQQKNQLFSISTQPSYFKREIHNAKKEKQVEIVRQESNEPVSTKGIFSAFKDKLALGDSFLSSIKGVLGQSVIEPTKSDALDLLIKKSKTNTVQKEEESLKVRVQKKDEEQKEDTSLIFDLDNLSQTAISLISAVKEQNQLLTSFKNNLIASQNNPSAEEQVKLLKNMLSNLKQLNEQTKQLRIERWEQNESSKAENVSELEKLVEKMAGAEHTRAAQLEKLELMVAKLQESVGKQDEALKKQDEAANSRLALLVAYSSILSLLFAILVFVIQYNQSNEKDKEEKANAAEKARQKAEDTEKKIEELQLKYNGWVNQKESIEDNIKNLEKSRDELIAMRSKWFNNTAIEIAIKDKEGDIGKAKNSLQYVKGELEALEIYVTRKQQEEANTETLQTENKTEKSEKSQQEDPQNFRPF